jgi:aspartate beta-hydroxylase
MTMPRQVGIDGHGIVRRWKLARHPNTRPCGTRAKIIPRRHNGIATNSMAQDPASLAVERARRALAAGEVDIAERHYAELLTTTPDHAEALGFIGTRLLRRGAISKALEPLRRAQQLAPEDPGINESLGIALLRSGNAAAAEAPLRKALNADAQLHRARLMLGKALALLGQERNAAIEYHRALATAQNLGIWMSDATTPAPLRDDVLRAVQTAQKYRRSIVDDALSPLRAQHGAAALARIDACVASYLGEHVVTPPDARQRPKTLYCPGLPAACYLPTDQLPWVDTLRTAAVAIREELIALRETDLAEFQPFLTFAHEAQVGRHLRSHGDAAPAWDAFFFYRHGQRNDANHARSPRTSAALEACPLNRIRGQAPEICFSVLTPGTHILPHHGDTNTRVVVHLPLIVPAGCALNVGGELHEWREGEPVVFDDTFEHEAWNRGNSDRVVLILDAWNPYLTEVEREALTALVPELGDFDRAVQPPAST